MVVNKNKEMHKKTERLRQAVNSLDRVKLGTLPTPLEELKRLSKKLAGPRIYIKRDDLTGLGMGGNKIRMLEFTIAKALKEGANCVIGTASVQSNYCCQLSAAAAKVGLEVYLILKKIRGDRDLIKQGNYFLDNLLGANIKIIESISWEQHIEVVNQLKSDLISEGRNPYIMRAVNIEDNWLDSMGYVNCFLELLKQLDEQDIKPDYLFVTGSDTTQAGLLIAQKYIGYPIEIIAIKPSLNGSTPVGGEKSIIRIMRRIANNFNLDITISKEEINLTTDYVGEGYGIASEKGINAIKMLSRTEGIFLDPVYSGKGFSGLIDFIRKGKLDRDDTVIFLHTGGLPSLFAYTEELFQE